MNTTDLVKNYFQLWATTDDEQRHQLVSTVFAPAAAQYVTPGDLTLQGSAAIEANIARVNRENIQTAGLHFRQGATRSNHNSVQVEWEVVDSAGHTKGTGRDFLLLDNNGRVTAPYMFRGE